MYGKSYESKYSGSMVGAGAMRFAVLDYVITMQKPSREWGSVVEINTVLLSVILGETQAAVEEAVGFLCSPDPKSRSKEKEGRRMVKVGEFLYQVVNGAKYRAIRDEEERRTQNREAQRRFVSKTKKSTPMAQRVRDQAEAVGDTATVQRIDEIEAGLAPGTLTVQSPPAT